MRSLSILIGLGIVALLVIGLIGIAVANSAASIADSYAEAAAAQATNTVALTTLMSQLTTCVIGSLALLVGAGVGVGGTFFYLHRTSTRMPRQNVAPTAAIPTLPAPTPVYSSWGGGQGRVLTTLAEADETIPEDEDAELARTLKKWW